MDIKKLPKDEQKRSFQVEKRNINEEDRTVELAFSSEEPYERFWGIEVLDHASASVRLGRLENGGAVLVEHRTGDQVGAVESVRIDSDRVGRAVVKFSRSARGQEIFQDIVDGIRNLVSVGYRVHKWEIEKKDGIEHGRAVDWEPMEISVVAIPADPTVGVGRSVEDNPKEEKTMPFVKDEKTAPAQVDTKAVEKEARQQARTDELNRINQIRAMADEHDSEDLGLKAIDEGWTYDKFNRELLSVVGQRNAEARSRTEESGDVGLTDKEKNRYSMTRLMHALAYPNDRSAQNAAGFELEVSDEGAKAFGADFKVRGAFVPPEVLQRDLSAGTATDGAELVADNLLAGSYIEVLRNAMVTAQAGATMLPGLVGNIEIPRQTSGAASTWISAEDGDATESEPQFDQVTMSPKDLACYTEVTRRLMMQSTPAIEGIVRRDLAIAQALGIDLAVLYGSGLSGQPTGVANATGINTFNFAAAAPTYAETVRMVKEVMADNALLGSLAYIIDPAGWEYAMTTVKDSGSGQFVLSESGTINGYQQFVTNQVTAEDWFFGNWADVLIGEWGGLEINVDPYTHSLKGKVRFITFKTVDVAVRHPQSFIHCNDGA